MSRNEIKAFYSNEMEKDRLEQELFKLEGIRTKEIIGRYLTQKPMDIADIGGAAGFYSFWLQSMGHRVSLIDLSPKNIELANAHSKKTGIQLQRCETGDATALNLASDQFDLVLLMGPLYHLTDKEERVRALSEAKRILRPGGHVLAAVISRYASLFDGFKRDLVMDNKFEELLVNDLKSGIHLNNTGNPEYFTTAFFHTPGEIKNEISKSGLLYEKLVAIESFGWIIDEFAKKSGDAKYMGTLNKFIRMVECDEDLIAMSQHIICVGVRPA